MLKHNMKTVVTVFLKKQRFVKLNFLQCLDTIGMKILSPKIKKLMGSFESEHFTYLGFFNNVCICKNTCFISKKDGMKNQSHFFDIFGTPFCAIFFQSTSYFSNPPPIHSLIPF